ncbi:hypothetical protein [Hydrogenimonas sp. SS33]|uniref:hypothetical protein n=1 Tax=Hydrogenimonas leucolamina TaxID=2954236 RepID=UPI00336BF964
MRGFKKTYFTLAAIQAYSTAAVMHARGCAYAARDRGYRTLLGTEAKEDPPPEESMEPESLLCPFIRLQGGTRPCHCNRHFQRLAYLLLYISEHFRRFLCRCRYTKTGLAPPFSEKLKIKS